MNETIPSARTQALSEKLLTAMNHAAMLLMVSLGHRTGLFDVLANLPPTTSSGIAVAAGLNERYVREWLGAMVTAGVMEYDAGRETYALPGEHAAILTWAPNNMASMAQWVAV